MYIYIYLCFLHPFLRKYPRGYDNRFAKSYMSLGVVVFIVIIVLLLLSGHTMPSTDQLQLGPGKLGRGGVLKPQI